MHRLDDVGSVARVVLLCGGDGEHSRRTKSINARKVFSRDEAEEKLQKDIRITTATKKKSSYKCVFFISLLKL